ncbi:DUF2589 domain-containing protein [Crocosphaera sp.]|uniref:DUF2589 domain-containing protein n=1 Tax=Crocosphaera sp. TaxID=2729996 RepID=UPI002621AD6C|nr:DUF2589 domain-containing protein [Crocosphaera sp.]MDJ0580947.1 DUF2589 domain-containing protein [Crocosphaera sp.]
MPAIDTTPSNVATSALQGIPFSSLIGGPLQAAIDAQAQSANTTIDFIQKVGLKDGKTIPVEFVYYADGREAKLIVPLLTILPIPYLAVDEVDIEFKANINASSSTYQEDTASSATSGSGSAEVKVGWGLFSAKAKFQASYSSKKDSKATQKSKYSVEYTMDVHVHAGQDSMPAGLAKVLNILEGSITSTANKANLQIAPSTLVASDPTNGKQKLLVTAILFDEKAMRVAGQTLTATIGTSKPAIEPLTLEPTDEDGTVEFEIKIPEVATTVQATATATMDTSDPSKVGTIKVDNGGSGYTSTPNVTITGGGGTGATATAEMDPANPSEATPSKVGTIKVDNGGSGYTSTPNVTIDPPSKTEQAQRVKLKLESTTPPASKTITIIIPEYTT